MFTLSEKSIKRLEGVRTELNDIVRLAITMTPIDFTVLEGLRTKERQEILFKAGKSQTMSSRHIVGEAVDLGVLVNGKVTWDWQYYEQLAKIMKQAAKELGYKITWGGDWKTFKDGVHFQLED